MAQRDARSWIRLGQWGTALAALGLIGFAAGLRWAQEQEATPMRYVPSFLSVAFVAAGILMVLMSRRANDVAYATPGQCSSCGTPFDEELSFCPGCGSVPRRGRAA